MKQFLPPFKNKLPLTLCWSFVLSVLLVQPLLAQEAKSIWEHVELTGNRYKVIGAYSPKNKIPVWVPVTGGVILGGVIIWLVTKGGDESGQPRANNDSVAVPCGQTSTTVDVLSNDSGDSIHVTSVTPAGGISVTIQSGGILQVSGIGASDFSFSYSIADGTGRTATATVQISVTDNDLPVITCPAQLAIDCSSSTDVSMTGSATATDACAGNQVEVSFTDDESGLTGCSGTGTLLRTWKATDPAGNTSQCTQTITISDQTPPEIQCPPASSVPCTTTTDPSITGFPIVSDNCSTGIQPSYSDDMSGVVNCMGDIIRTWTVTDNCGNQQSCNQTISVMATQQPTVTCPSNITIQCGDSTDPAETGTATAEYHCGNPDLGNVTFSDDNSGLTGCNGTGTILRTWTATDACGSQATCTQTITIQDTALPAITCPSNLTIECGQSIQPSATGSATADDACGGSANVNLTFEDDDSGLTGCGNTGSLLRTWTATDACDNSQSCTQTIAIEDQTPPQIQCPPNTSILCLVPPNPAVTGMPVVSDNCSQNLQPTYSDDMSGVVNCMGDIIRTWMVTDDCGNQATCTQTITVTLIPPPVITCPPNIAVQCNTSTDPSVTGTGSAIFNCGNPDNGTLNFSDNTSGLNGCNNTGNLLRTWIAIDDCGIQQTCLQIITIQDVIPPVITCPSNTTVSCSASIAPSATGMATATDNCGPPSSITITFQNNTSGLTGCNGTGTLIRTWKATDACGNMQTCNQTITLQDNTAPAITCPSNLSVQCHQSTAPSNTGMATATDNCGTPSSITITFQNNTSGLTGCNGTGTLIRTWKATDACGNMQTCNQTITVQDNVAPTITCPANLTVQCNQSTMPSATGSATANDNCTSSASITISFEDDASGLTGCNGTGILLRTWTAADACGNLKTCNQTISVVDEVVPMIQCPPDVTIKCTQQPDPPLTGAATANDNCTSAPEISYTDDTTGVANCMGELIRTWTAEDDCGNVSTCEQVINIEPVPCTFTVDFDITDAHCGVADGSVSATPSPPSNYHFAWSNGATGPTLSNVNAGNYMVTITDVNLSCSLVFSVTVGQLPVQYASGINVEQATCTTSGDISFLVNSPGMGPFTIDVAGPNGNFTVNDIPQGTQVHLNDYAFIVAGNYIISVTDVSAGASCVQTFSAVVPEGPPYPIEILEINNPSSPSAHNGSIVAMVADPNATPPFVIFLNGAFYDVSSDFTFTISNLTVGTYTIKVVDANNCPSQEVTVTLMANLFNGNIQLFSINDGSSLPSVVYSSTPEQPKLEAWQVKNWIAWHQEALQIQGFLNENYEWRIGFSYSSGDAFYENATGQRLNLPFTALSGSQELRRVFPLSKNKYFFGAGLQESTANFSSLSNGYSFDSPFWWQSFLSAGVEIYSGKLFRWEIPAMAVYGGSGRFDFSVVPKVTLSFQK